MPTLFRATFFFKNRNGAGWTETLYSQAAGMQLVQNEAIALIPARVGLLGRGAALKFIRVSDDLIKRDSLIYVVPTDDGAPKSRQTDDADIANTCLLLRVESGFTKRRSLFLRGVPDEITQDNGVYTPPAAFTAALNAYRIIVVGGTWAIKIRGDSGAVSNITNVSTVGPTGLVTITTAANHGFNMNDVVNIRGVLGATQVRGLQKVVTTASPTTFDIRVNRVVRPYLGAGNVVKNDYTLVDISGLVPVRCSHHNAGRPFDSPVGRRRVR